MNEKYIVICRYEHWTKNGKEFNDWFDHNIDPMTKEEAEHYIKELKEKFEFIDKKTKLKHEYCLKLYSEYVNEQKMISAQNEELNRQFDEYKKSDEYKELLRKKRQSAKERKEHQKKYLEEHNLTNRK